MGEKVVRISENLVIKHGRLVMKAELFNWLNRTLSASLKSTASFLTRQGAARSLWRTRRGNTPSELGTCWLQPSIVRILATVESYRKGSI